MNVLVLVFISLSLSLSLCFSISHSLSLSFSLSLSVSLYISLFVRNADLPACPRQVGSSDELCEFLYATPSSLTALGRTGARVNLADF